MAKPGTLYVHTRNNNLVMLEVGMFFLEYKLNPSVGIPVSSSILPFLVFISTKVTSKKGVLQVKVCFTPGFSTSLSIPVTSLYQ